MKRNRGFTLVELMIVMAVIAVLATMALIGFRTAQQAARDTERQSIVRGIQTGLECYMGDNGSYPQNLNWGALSTSLAGCFSSTTVSDPLTPQTSSSGSDTWTVGQGNVSYVYSRTSLTTYTITLTTERGKVVVFNSPQ